MAHKSEIEAKRAKLEELRRKRAAISSSAQTSTDNGPGLSSTGYASSGVVPQRSISTFTDRSSIDSIVDSIVAPSSGALSGTTNIRDNERPDNTNSDPDTDTDKYVSKVFPIFDISPQYEPKTLSYNKEVQTDEWVPEPEPLNTSSKDANNSYALSPNIEDDNSDHESSQYDSTKEDLASISFLGNEEAQLKEQFKRLETQADEEKKALQAQDAEPGPESTDTTAQTNPSAGQAHLVGSYSFFDDSELGDMSSAERDYVQLAQLKAEDITTGRAVTSLDWSPRYPELLAASYTESSTSARAAKGLVCVWNIRNPGTPEFVLTAPSNILAVRFSQFDSKIVFGAAYNGQLFSWNLKTGNKPILSTPVTGIGHNHPIFSLQLIGTQHANTLFSVSTDGTFCTWAPDILASPLEQLSLSIDAKDVSPTCMAISTKDHTQFLVGTEESVIYQGNRFSHAGSKAGLDSRGYYKGHTAPISALDVHPNKSSNIDLGDYVLSSGFDWTINIWKYQEWGSINTADNYTEPLISITRDDVVYDVAWSPFSPNVFASVDGTGHLEIWDLLKDIDTPALKVKPVYHDNGTDADAADTGDSTANKEVLSVLSDQNFLHLNRPLNKLCWDKTQDSRRLAVGGLDGIVTIIELSPRFMPHPKAEDWKAVKALLSRLEQ